MACGWHRTRWLHDESWCCPCPMVLASFFNMSKVRRLVASVTGSSRQQLSSIPTCIASTCGLHHPFARDFEAATSSLLPHEPGCNSLCSASDN